MARRATEADTPQRAPDFTSVPQRELSVDLYRVLAVVLVVIGHWLASSLVFRDGEFSRQNPLVLLPWTQWLTWIFQTVPVLFLAAGYANAASWSNHPGVAYRDWFGTRSRAVLGPTTGYVVVVLVVIGAALAASTAAGIDASSIDLSAWAVAMHLWFIPVYLVLVAMTPWVVAAHRRWGLAVPLSCAAGVVVADVVSLIGWFGPLHWVNNLLCWLAIYATGTAWYFGALRGVRPILLAGAAAGVTAAAMALGPYPVSLIGLPGDGVQNSVPPSIVMMGFGLTQAGLLVALAPAVTRWLRRSAVRRPLAAANSRVMLLYLWHMVAVVIVAVAAYPAGVFPQPPIGTGAWWAARLLWIVVLSVTTALELWLISRARSLLAGSLPSVPLRVSTKCAVPMLAVGAGCCVVALWYLAIAGFAPSGHFPVWAAATYAAGVAVTVLRPTGR